MAISTLGNGWRTRILEVVGTMQRTAADAFGLRPLALPVEPIAELLDLVVSWNLRTNLTRARSPDELVDLYLADAALLAAAAVASPEHKRWVDVGSGGGAPGLGLGLLAPGIELTLVEPRGKRVAFLRTALGRLGRVQVTVLRQRSSELPPKAWNVAVSRATLPPDEWLGEGARLAEHAVWVLLARSPPPELEGWRVRQDLGYRWPLTQAERRAVLFVPVPEQPA
jgi:16S rRNA (guanine527-N7)-methyltransferase